MNLSNMLERCHREQWSIADLDWTGTPRPMTRADEEAIVQYFTDMAAIERLAKALFAEQGKKTDDPVLRQIFDTFVVDEERHAVSAEHLARYYDVHHYRAYAINPALARFTPHFIRLIESLSAEVANLYITAGEVMLDIALLRSINDYVADDMSQAAMDRVNRDESRHLAIDFHMVEYYGSEAYEEKLEQKPPADIGSWVRGSWSLANVLYYAAPFTRGVFFDPMRVVDAGGKRMREAMKRMQLLSKKRVARRHPVVTFLMALQDVCGRSDVVRTVFGSVAGRITGIEPEFLARFYTADEARRAVGMSFDEHAMETLAAKAIH